MKKSNVYSLLERERLDNVNNERYLNTKKRVAEVIRLLNNVLNSDSISVDDIDKLIDKISKAINILELAEEEMRWHCEWYEYDDSVCMLMNDACANFGSALAKLLDEDDFDDISIVCDINDALVKMSKVLATLVRWEMNDEMC